MSKEFDYDSFPWSDYFKLDSTSPSGLVWNKVTYSLGGNKLETWVGKPAGGLYPVKNKDNKAWKVSFNVDGRLKNFSVHRIIAVLNGMKVNGFVIDHINGITADNRVENLRVTTQAINSRNCKVQDNSPYGIPGVSSQQDKNGNLYFIARTTHLGNRVQKNFPVKLLGVMEAFKQAVIARQKMIHELNQEGAGYSDRHCNIDENVFEYESFVKDNSLIKKAKRTLKKRANNSSGVTGVYIEGNKPTNTRISAHWIDEYEDGVKKQKSKHFSVAKLGLLPAFAEAVKYRQAMIAKLNEQGYGYTDKHGQ